MTNSRPPRRSASSRSFRTIWLHRPSTEQLGRLLHSATSRELSYAEVGATRADLPAGYARDRVAADLGRFEPDRFRRAAATLESFGVQVGAGMTVFPGSTVRDGDTILIVFRLPFGGYIAAPGRVVYVIDEPDRRGFAYGTVHGHPEQGEEAFVVARRGERLRFEITAFSRPRHPLARAGRPLSRLMQRRATRRYMAAMRAALG